MTAGRACFVSSSAVLPAIDVHCYARPLQDCGAAQDKWRTSRARWRSWGVPSAVGRWASGLWVEATVFMLATRSTIAVLDTQRPSVVCGHVCCCRRLRVAAVGRAKEISPMRSCRLLSAVWHLLRRACSRP